MKSLQWFLYGMLTAALMFLGYQIRMRDNNIQSMLPATPTPQPTAAPTPCPTPDLQGRIWERRERCFEYVEYMQKHGDYPPEVNDFLATHYGEPVPAWACDKYISYNAPAELIEGCITYYELVDPYAHHVPYLVKYKIKIPVTTYHWETRSVTITAQDDYWARKNAFAKVKEDEGYPEDYKTLTVTRVK